jgi:D-methionine transport system substrate-binding protein
MKKSFGIIAAAILAAAVLTACGGSKTAETTAAATEAATTAASAAETQAAETTAAASEAAQTELEEVVVGASPAPHAEILEAAKDLMAEKGYKLTIVEYTDYVQPNLALESGDLDANYFQHQPYLTNFNDENGTKLVSAATIHYEPFGIYAGKTASLDALADGATVAVPNDATNEARALLLLQDQGLITLADGVGLNATKTDIVDNSKNLNIMEIEAAQVPRSLQDVDIAVINGNYAIDAGLKVSDALATEAADSLAASTYGNVVAVREGNENDPAIQALVECLKSDTIKNFINETYDGAVVPMF